MTVDSPLAKARGLSLRTGAQTMLYLILSLIDPTLTTITFQTIDFLRGCVAIDIVVICSPWSRR